MSDETFSLTVDRFVLERLQRTSLSVKPFWHIIESANVKLQISNFFQMRDIPCAASLIRSTRRAVLVVLNARICKSEEVLRTKNGVSHKLAASRLAGVTTLSLLDPEEENAAGSS